MKTHISVGLLGLGVVGSEVFKLLQDEAFITARAGFPIRVERIAVAHLEKSRRDAVPRDMLTSNPLDVIESPDVDIVAEVMGGIEPARTCLLRGMALGKAAVTANKQLMATHGAELLQRAKGAGVDLAFEASVGAGIPLIKPLKESLVAAHIYAVTGILNGTTNYVLTRMARDGSSFEEALGAAQQRGFAEANPTEDVDGHDAAAKLAILASVAFNSPITISDVYREGIGRITPRDIAYARELGFGIKLLAIGREQDEQIEVRVHPALIPLDHPLSLVADEFNAVLVEGRDLGPVVFSGRGAGGAPTATAIVADIVDCARNVRAGARARVQPGTLPARRLRPIDDVVRPQFVSLQVTDRPGVFAIVASIFGEEHVSIASIVQKSRGTIADVVLVTHATPERAMRRVLQRLGDLDVVKAINNRIRVEAEV